MEGRNTGRESETGRKWGTERMKEDGREAEVEVGGIEARREKASGRQRKSCGGHKTECRQRKARRQRLD